VVPERQALVTRYVFVGAGAVGSALGGFLAQQGSEVLLVARGDHGRAMIKNGLTVRCPDTTLNMPVPVVTAPDQTRLTVNDVLVLTTKTQHAEFAINEWTDVPVHGRDGTVAGRAADLLPIFTATNGVTSEELALRYVNRVFAVCVWFSTVMIEPGEVIVRSAPLRGVFHIGRYGVSSDPADDARLLDNVSRDWEAAGCVIRRPEAVMEWKYRKLLANIGNALQALLGDTTGAEDVQRAAEVEARTILSAAGIAFTDDEEARAGWRPEGLSFRSVPGEPAQLGGSSWQSLIRDTGTIETDFLNGEIALIARRLGQLAPINTQLTALARRAARERLRPGSVGVEELRSRLTLGPRWIPDSSPGA
jgi:2-dehydropantoate 2-reductase